MENNLMDKELKALKIQEELKNKKPVPQSKLQSPLFLTAIPERPATQTEEAVSPPRMEEPVASPQAVSRSIALANDDTKAIESVMKKKDEAPPKEDGTGKQVLGYAISQLAPMLLGGLFGGTEGAVEGYDRGQKKLDELRVQENIEKERVAREKEAEESRKLATLQQDKSLAHQEKLLDKRLGAENAMAMAKAQASNTPLTLRDRMNSLGADEKKSVGLLSTALKNASELTQLFNAGKGGVFERTSITGHTKFSLATEEAAKAIARLESGAAIGKEEKEDYLALLPTVADTSSDMARHKLAKLQQKIVDRLHLYDMSASDFGVNIPTAEETAKNKMLFEEALKIKRGNK